VRHPDRARIEPEAFIPLAERDERTIWELTLLAVNRSLGDVSAWGEVASDVTIFINPSSVSLGRRDLAAAFSPILEQHRFPRHDSRSRSPRPSWSDLGTGRRMRSTRASS
jgi:EAL domain-containing protein (putative c-di-GMP-specific phosphodiesterase class I)